jgi:hypothetical protein
MKVFWRVLIALAITVVVVVVGISWVVPAALSFYLAKKAPPAASVVPTELKDQSVSNGSGAKLTYFGYEFEVPWSDVGEVDRKPFANKNSGEDSAWVSFRSGLKLLVSAAPADATSSNYAVTKLIYEFDPSTIRAWPPSPRAQYQRLTLFMGKSVILSNPLSAGASSGIFNLDSKGYKGFQLGNPQLRPDTLCIKLYSDEGSFEIYFFQVGYVAPSGVTQPEINRIVQSLHKTASKESNPPSIAQK